MKLLLAFYDANIICCWGEEKYLTVEVESSDLPCDDEIVPKIRGKIYKSPNRITLKNCQVDKNRHNALFYNLESK